MISLWKIVREERFCCTLAQLNNPEWEMANRVHDWRNHVPESLIGLWSEFSEQTRLALYIVAEHLSEDEEWD